MAQGSNTTGGGFDFGHGHGTAVAMATTVGGLLIIGLLLRKVFRAPPSDVEVNCWFCQTDCTVPNGNQNCWDCPHCDQYNGFQEDGDYNKPIPAQFHEELNYAQVSAVPAPDATPARTWNILCPSCNRKQVLKVQQLAEFVPTDEATYDEEVEAYSWHLEQLHQVCGPCQVAVGCHLRRQDQTILADFMGGRLRRFHPRNYAGALLTVKTPAHITILRLVAATVAALLLLLNLLRSKTLPANLQEKLPDILRDFAETDSVYTVVFVGLFVKLTAVLLAGKDRLRSRDALCVLLWLLTLVVHIPWGVGKLAPGVGMVPPVAQTWSYVAIRFTLTLKITISSRPLSPWGSDASYLSGSPPSVSSTLSTSAYSTPRPRSPLHSVRQNPNRAPDSFDTLSIGKHSVGQTPNRPPVPDNFDTLSIGKHSCRSSYSHSGPFGFSHDSPASLFSGSRKTSPQFTNSPPRLDTTLPETSRTSLQFDTGFGGVTQSGRNSPQLDSTVTRSLPLFDTTLQPQFGKSPQFGRNSPQFGVPTSWVRYRSQRPIISPAKFQPPSRRARQSPSRELIGVKSLSIHDDGEIRRRPRQLFSDGDQPLTTALEQEADAQYETSSAYGSASVSGSDAGSSDGGNTTSSCRVHSTTSDPAENLWRPVTQTEKPSRGAAGSSFLWKWLFGLSVGCNTVLVAYVVMQFLSNYQS
ncbi:PREDICTED: transmembrane protein 201-like [Branchiostoma belcheri]|uniref:Transmembrane protein 201-like n=1 Tax=Branchiostoma belcheri TaxID=7741 RepID=A0A6P4XC89_BRABE|nr:PREDICTED: transmembrane protein 201-like [Branchiostoma belcheri]